MTSAADISASSLWDRLLDDLEQHLDPECFHEYFAHARPLGYDETEKTLTVGTPSNFHCRWLEGNVGEVYESVKRIGESSELIICFKVDRTVRGVALSAEEEMAANGSRALTPPSGRLLRPASPARVATMPTKRRSTPTQSQPAVSGLNPKYTFDNFVIGENNRFAHAAAFKFSKPSSAAFNPLFLYSGVGLGKTHLLHAIGNRMLEEKPNARIVYATSEAFMNNFIDSLSSGSQLSFRQLYRNVDLLLIDDVQFFCNKERTQTEFFHTFNALYEAGRKIILTSDVQPTALDGLEERLVSRFEWGLIVDIQVPDLETRMAILRQKATAEGLELSNEVIYYIAEHVQTHVRALEQALNRLRTYSEVEKRPIDLPMCSENLSALIFTTEQRDKVTIERIQEAVCEYYQLDLKDLIGKSRAQKFAAPRHVAMFLARELTGASFPEIGGKFGNRDHTSVMHAYRKVEREHKEEPRVSNAVSYIRKQLNGSANGGSTKRK